MPVSLNLKDIVEVVRLVPREKMVEGIGEQIALDRLQKRSVALVDIFFRET